MATALTQFQWTCSKPVYRQLKSQGALVKTHEPKKWRSNSIPCCTSLSTSQTDSWAELRSYCHVYVYRRSKYVVTYCFACFTSLPQLSPTWCFHFRPQVHIELQRNGAGSFQNLERPPTGIKPLRARGKSKKLTNKHVWVGHKICC